MLWSPASAARQTNGTAIGCYSTSCLTVRASACSSKRCSSFPDLLRRSCWQTDRAGNDPRLNAFARALHLGVLPDDLRLEVADGLESAALTNLDTSFFDEEKMLALIPPLRLV